jgi:hypothetical protein
MSEITFEIYKSIKNSYLIVNTTVKQLAEVILSEGSLQRYRYSTMAHGLSRGGFALQ